MPNTLNVNAALSPGTYVTDAAAGFIPVELASFATTYMIGTGAKADAPKDVPTQVVSADDFTNQFGTSGSLTSVKLYFVNNPNGILYFVNATAVAPATPTAPEFVASIQKAFDPEMAQGFLIAPQAFSSLTTQSDRTSVAVAMENLAAGEGYDWMVLVDAGPASGTGAVDTAAKANTEGQLYTSERGHLAYFFPYLIDLEDNTVPPSAAIAGLAVRRYKAEGFQQPPAGAKFPVRGVKDVKVKLTKANQEVANPLGINYIRNLPNKGVVCWGSRTRSSSAYYRFVNTRVILNVLAGTLKGAFDSEIFTAVDGQGVLFSRIRQTIEEVCYRLWLGGALFGQTPRDAYAVECSLKNNPVLDLEAGVVRADAWVVPSPTMERLFIAINRTPIGQVQTVVADALGV
jgi:uncharacterized protein